MINRHRSSRGFTMAETLIAIFLVGMAMGMLGLLFQRSFMILRTLDDKERARQAGRMGLDRLTSELREATFIKELGDSLTFEKIDPNATVTQPWPVPEEPDENFVPLPWKPEDAYPASARLEVRYSTADEALIREVRSLGSGAWVKQVVVVGVNAFTCKENPQNKAEIEVVVSVLDNRKISTLSSRVLCPCIREPFQ